jgi:uncharacterized protein (TIGR02217 family)
MHSNLVLSPPWELIGGFPSKKPTFETIVHTPVSKRGEIRASLQPYPIWEIEYSLDNFRGGEQVPDSVYQYLLGFYIAMGGQFSDFLYWDENDNTIPADSPTFVAIGDGTTTLFQLIRTIGIGEDIVQNPAMVPTPPILYVDGSSVSYTLGQTGQVTMATAPANGAVITWSGSFYYRVRFADDGLDFEQFMQQLWDVKKLTLQSVIL